MAGPIFEATWARSKWIAFLLATFSLRAECASTRPGWPVSYSTPGAASLARPNVQFVDVDGDGTRELVLAWFAYRAPDYTGSIEILSGSGKVIRRIDRVGIHHYPTFFDREDDGQLEIAAGRTNGISVFGLGGMLEWEHNYAEGDPVLDGLIDIHPSVGFFDDDGEPSIVASSSNSRVYMWTKNGTLRPGFPFVPDGFGPFWEPPSVVDLDEDGKDEALFGGANGYIHCYDAAAISCDGWPYVYRPGAWNYRFDLGAPISYRHNDGRIRLFAISGRSVELPAIHNLDERGALVGAGLIVDPGVGFGNDSFSLFESNRDLLAAIGGTTNDHVLSVETGNFSSGWPAITSKDSQCHPAIANLGTGSEPGILFAGFSSSTSTDRIEARTLTGTLLPGIARSLSNGWSIDTVAIGTFDGVETTVCWTVGADSGGTGVVDCFDLGVPWNRRDVQWGNASFDWRHTSFFRRLGQISRPLTSLAPALVEAAADSGVAFDVTVCPRDAAGLPLGRDQEIRFARRPVVGQFGGPIREDLPSGCWSRRFVGPADGMPADVEFRVFVNDELDDDRPIVRFRRRPSIVSVQPIGVPRAGPGFPIDLEVVVTEGDLVTGVESTTPNLVVDVEEQVGKLRWRAAVFAPLSAELGWSGLRLTSRIGPGANVAPVFVYDPAELTLVAREPTAGTIRLDWFDGTPIPPFTLERSPDPLFPPGSTTVVSSGSSMTASEPLPAGGVVFYRVRANGAPGPMGHDLAFGE